MRIWLCLQSFKPKRWAVRYGRKWRVVKRISVNMPMRTKFGKIQPYAYLVGDGRVRFSRSCAYLEARP